MPKDIRDQLTELKPEQSIALLKELHILTREGKINQDSRRKLKQVYHLYQFILPLMKDVVDSNDGQLLLVDHGAGKSYLGFILYDLFLKSYPKALVFGIESRPELVKKSQELADKLGFTQGMMFYDILVEQALVSDKIPEKVDIVTALHACDTATYDALKFGLKKSAKYIVLVPCCQAEVASVLRRDKGSVLGKTALSELWRHPIHTREFGSHITNVLRCLQLEAMGYQVTVTELVGWEHSMKNELIIAKYIGQKRKSSRERQLDILNSYHLGVLKERFAYDI
ncbi:class I SAM-dependent methyltransferase [Taylorella equigenitalis]|uniref:Methyltransferase domain-containing protein n=1 Tax=Taylorella equigenitalis ATCC 35865 TaxID=743973 RepID=A0ABN4ATB7_9BURK|nr:SAM-dependent methyltransferase [Taylorella equigenitalis]AFN35122.1 hypothetical protein KUI_0016 [Taylorella equigenitalis ATCC 35865]VEG32910.1 Uncharacterised protein [Taylorella equigenitalis ATCC 35865]